MSGSIPVKSSPADPDLVREAKKGSLTAFNALAARHQTLLYNVAYRVTGNPDLAADATQEALILAYRRLHQYRGGSLRAWLARIATNCAYDQLRARKRQSTTSLEDMVEEEDRLGALEDPHASPEDAALATELGEAIAAAVLTLPEDQRSVIALVDYNHFDYEETAQALDISLGTVKSRLSRARARVRNELLRRHPELLASRMRQ
ncbi:MAG: sigma-70 family RNA polymerase sigma factor [Anaerolineae bacterium]|nr:sigma-70 family RNA polymerase sigma factor [Anaerolineae bacterium]